MAFIETEFEKAFLSELDFDPLCDCQLKFNLFGRIWIVYQCSELPRWTTDMACCMQQALSCPKHRYSTGIRYCSRCRQWATVKLRWRRI
jgi:hypothetical protein